MSPCLVGLHGSADGSLGPTDLAAYRDMRAEAAVLLSLAGPQSYEALLGVNPSMLIVVRAYVAMADGTMLRHISAEQYFTDTVNDLAKFYAVAQQHGLPLYVQIANEPNVVGEGISDGNQPASWRNAGEFQQWYLRVLAMYRARFPGARFLFPGLSPGPAVGVRIVTQEAFALGCKDAIAASDGICVHCYWSTTEDMLTGGGANWRWYVQAFPGKELFIGECNDGSGVDMTKKGIDYAMYCALLAPPVRMAAWFCSTASHPDFAKFVVAGTPWPAQVGKRWSTPVPLYSAVTTAVLVVRDAYGRDTHERIAAGQLVQVYDQGFVGGRTDLRSFISPPPATRNVAAQYLRKTLPPLEVECDGFDAPVGTPEQRAGSQVWPFGWVDANRYLNVYYDSAHNLAYHTGGDLNLNTPRFDADAHAPVYAVASGQVVAAQWVNAYWRNVAVTRHLYGGKVYYVRYAHLENFAVAAAQSIARGVLLGHVGYSGLNGPYHLHFDISPTAVLLSDPGHWPGLNRAGVVANYVDPLAFILARRPVAR